MRRALLLAFVGTLAVAFAPTSAIAGASFTDPAGDANGGPDIRAVTIRRADIVNVADPEGNFSGVVVVGYTVTNLRLSPGINDAEIVSALDTNQDGYADYFISFGIDTKGHYVDIYKASQLWKKPLPQSPTMRHFYTLDGKHYEVWFSPADLGGTTGFDFAVTSLTWAKGNDNATERDRAPNDEIWSYSLGVKPVLGPATTSPTQPLAGKAFTLTLPVARSDTGDMLPGTATMTCEPTIDGVVIPHREQLKNGVATLRLTVPAGAAGKKLTVKVTITLEAKTATRGITLPIS